MKRTLFVLAVWFAMTAIARTRTERGALATATPEAWPHD